MTFNRQTLINHSNIYELNVLNAMEVKGLVVVHITLLFYCASVIPKHLLIQMGVHVFSGVCESFTPVSFRNVPLLTQEFAGSRLLASYLTLSPGMTLRDHHCILYHVSRKTSFHSTKFIKPNDSTSYELHMNVDSNNNKLCLMWDQCLMLPVMNDVTISTAGNQ